jgi:RHS repeat-associated protein
LTRHQRSAFEPLARGQSPPWRVKGNGSDEVTLQVFPHARYIDEVVGLRVKDQGRMYAHQAEGDQGGSLKDWNVTALTDLTGRVIEQYWYSPYGQLEAHVAAHPFDFDDDGDVDAQDIAAGTSGGTCWGDYDGAGGDCKRLDADGDRDIDVDDYTIISNYVATRHSEAALQRIPAASHSRRGNLFAHQGLPLDAELASYQNRARQYAPAARRFMQVDSMMYIDSMALYLYVNGRPVTRRDPFGERESDDPYDGCCCGKSEEAYAASPGSGMDAEEIAVCGAMSQAAELIEPGTGLPDVPIGEGQSNSFRHCYWQCITARRIGARATAVCGNIHEACNNGKPGADAMDLHNNKLGRAIGAAPGASDITCYTGCYNSAVAAGSANCPPSPTFNPALAQTCAGGTPTYNIVNCD